MAGQSNDTEKDQLAKAVAGDRAAFARLVTPHAPRLLTTALRVVGARAEAEDAVQDALASLWVTRARLDVNRPILPMLTTITLNKCRDRLRRRKTAAFFGLNAQPDFAVVDGGAPSPETETADREELLAVYSAIQQLPIRLREALILVAIDGRSQGEAGELLGVTEKAIETRVYRARKLLRERLKKI